jgi:glucan endo-1,3-beta-D-glucosidase
MRSTSLFAVLASASTALAIQGFNYGAVKIDGTTKVEADFKSEFAVANTLAGTNGDFASARLYTTIVSFLPSVITQSTGVETNDTKASWF